MTVRKKLLTRMHSSRMRTVRSSDRISGVEVSAPGGCLLPAGVSALGGVCYGGCLLLRGVCSGRCLLRGVSALGGMVSQHALRQTPPPPPRGQTDACKNITFATSLRTVIRGIAFIFAFAKCVQPLITLQEKKVSKYAVRNWTKTMMAALI